MADPATCLKNARVIDPKARLCAIYTCEQDPAREAITRFCHCLPPYPKQDPCPYGANTPVLVYDSPTTTCFCCCSCFAYGTKIADTIDTTKDIQLFRVGEPVLAAGRDLNWSEATVEFSAGVKPHPHYGKTVIVVYYGTADRKRSIVVTPDHVFAVKAGEGLAIKRARRLVAGDDQLIASDGSPVAILATETGGWHQGLHHIATTNRPAKNLEGHLLISDGLVSADWAVQISDLDSGAFAALNTSSDDPELGTAEFEAQHPSLARGRFAAVSPGAEIEDLRPDGFLPYGRETLEIPADAAPFLTRAQAEELLENGKQRPVTDSAGQEAVFYLFKLIACFYPDINFHMVWDELLPNAYSFRRYGLDVVVLSGGLVRTEGVTFDGLALILAHEVGHLIGGPPLDPSNRYSCQGQADFAGMGAVLRGVHWVGDYAGKSTSGLDEVRKLFGLIKAEPECPDKCNNISLDCRLAAMRAAMRMGPLPECAGGPAVPFLAPIGVRVETGRVTSQVLVTFNLPLAHGKIEKSSLSFAPEAAIPSAEVSRQFPELLTIVAELAPHQFYELTIENLVSEDGRELDGGRAVIPLGEIQPSTGDADDR